MTEEALVITNFTGETKDPFDNVFMLTDFVRADKLAKQCVAESAWPALEEYLIKRANGVCEICNAPNQGKFRVHERWSYDLANYKAKLEKYMTICAFCYGIMQAPKVLSRDANHAYEIHVKKINRMDADALLTFADEIEKYKWKLYGIRWGYDLSLLTENNIPIADSIDLSREGGDIREEEYKQFKSKIELFGCPPGFR